MCLKDVQSIYEKLFAVNLKQPSFVPLAVVKPM
jgi:hypothetical protein